MIYALWCVAVTHVESHVVYVYTRTYIYIYVYVCVDTYVDVSYMPCDVWLWHM